MLKLHENSCDKTGPITHTFHGDIMRYSHHTLKNWESDLRYGHSTYAIPYAIRVVPLKNWWPSPGIQVGLEKRFCGYNDVFSFPILDTLQNIYIYIYVYIYMYIYICICMYIYICIYVYIYVYIYICIHVYIYIDTDTNIYTSMCIYIHIMI